MKVIVGLLLFLVGAGVPANPLDRWLQDLPASEDLDAFLTARIEESGGTPLEFGDEILFLARSSGTAGPRIVGDFNDGGYDGSGFLGEGKMTRIRDSAWFFLRAECPADATFDYRIRRGNDAAPDPLNPRKVVTFASDRSLVERPSARKAPVPSEGAPRGELRSFVLKSAIRRNERKVTVYLPPETSPSGERLPTLYVKDGSGFREQADLPGILDALIAAERIPPVIAVFIDPVQRALEYGTATSYRRLVVEELVPEVERRFPSGGSPRRRGLLGASRGGLAVVDLQLRHPEIFGFAAPTSPALSPLPIFEAIESTPSVRGRFLLLISRYDNPGLVEDGRTLAQALKGRAEGLVVREIPADHTFHAWRRWLDLVLETWIEEVDLDR